MQPRVLVVTGAVLVAVAVMGVAVGPVSLGVRGVVLGLLDRLPLVDVDSGLTPQEAAVLWELRVPRVVLGGLVGGTLALAGASYQGVFRNPLADPYLLGVAAGAGLGLALGCDMRIMAESAFLTSSFTAIGLVPDSGTTWWLPRHVGVSKAIELTMTNKRVKAEEARSLGLCAEVVPDGEVVVRAVELATTLADMVPDALVTTRRLVRDAVELSFGEALEAERLEQGRLGKTAEHREGVAAFLEKRKPDFRNAG